MADERERAQARRAREQDGSDGDSSSGEPEQLTFGQHVVEFFKELTAVVIGAVIVASLLRAFVGQMFLIPSVSMENTLQVQDRVIVEKLTSIKRGEVAVFADPGGWLAGPAPAERGPIGGALEFIGLLPDASTEHLIKRVIGLAGDRVICCDADGRISVNGQPLVEDSYLFTSDDGVQVKPSSIRFEVDVPAGRVFVMGDSRDHSRDSRCHLNDLKAGLAPGENAFVAEEQVVGRAVAVVWPLSRRHTLPIPATFESVPPGKQPAPDTPAITAGPEANC